jgi:hypothetical protein
MMWDEHYLVGTMRLQLCLVDRRWDEIKIVQSVQDLEAYPSANTIYKLAFIPNFIPAYAYPVVRLTLSQFGAISGTELQNT